MSIWLILSVALFAPLHAAEEPESAEANAAPEVSEEKLEADLSLQTTEQLIAESQRLAPTVKDIRSTQDERDWDNKIDMYFPAACARADEKQLQQLFDIYLGLPQLCVEKIQFLPFLARRRIELEIVKIKAEELRVSFPEPKIEVPAQLKKDPQELVAAWQLYQRATVACEKSFPRDIDGKNKIDAHVNAKSFQSLLRKAFFENERGIEKQLSEYADTGAGCLDVRDISDAQDFATLVILLRERRLNEAVGAALRVAGTQGSISSPEVAAPAVVEFFKTCGIDWEKLLAGAQVAALLEGNDSGYRQPFLEALARYGGPHAATLLNHLSHRAKGELQERFVHLFDLWIDNAASAQKCNGEEVEVGALASESWKPQPIPSDIQRNLLRTTEEFVSSDCSRGLAQSALHIFGRTQSRSSVAALRQLTLHNDEDVARDAATVLCAMGENVPPVAVGQPVQFRLLVNGDPLPVGARVEFTVESDGGTRSSTVEIGPDGVVALERRLFTNPKKRPKRIHFDHFDHFGGDDARVLQFAADLPPPSNLDAIIPVDIEASALELNIKNAARLKVPLPEKTRLYFLPHRGPEVHPLFHSGAHELEVSVGDSISVPLIQNDVYDIGLALPGAEEWVGQVVVGPNSEPVEVNLKQGSDVRCKIITPTGDEITADDLVRDGHSVNVSPDYRTHTYRALGLGNYVLRIYGTEHWKRPDDRRGPDEVAFLGQDVPFTISESSPAVVDLGEIHLAPDTR